MTLKLQDLTLSLSESKNTHSILIGKIQKPCCILLTCTCHAAAVGLYRKEELSTVKQLDSTPKWLSNKQPWIHIQLYTCTHNTQAHTDTHTHTHTHRQGHVYSNTHEGTRIKTMSHIRGGRFGIHRAMYYI